MPEPSHELEDKPILWMLSCYWIYAHLLVCILTMLPRLISPHFGLMDDSRAPTIAQGSVHGKWDLSWVDTEGYGIRLSSINSEYSNPFSSRVSTGVPTGCSE